jgi:hypothetical protein
VRENTEILGDPPGYFSHSQNFTTTKDTIHLLNLQVKIEKEFPPGIKRDLIIVNSNVGSKEGNKFIKKLNNKKINNGKIITYTRKNIGMSYGAYNDAFLKFRNKYDFFLFIEDDIITVKKNYLKIGYKKFLKTKNCGFVAFIGLSRVKKDWWKKAGLNNSNAISAYGGCGLTSTFVLNKIVDKIGYLPHNTKNINQKESIIYGELSLSKVIIDLGFRLTELRNEVLTMPAYDYIRGIDYKKYPSFHIKYFWIIKSFVYNQISKFQLLLKYYLLILKILKKIY